MKCGIDHVRYFAFLGKLLPQSDEILEICADPASARLKVRLSTRQTYDGPARRLSKEVESGAPDYAQRTDDQNDSVASLRHAVSPWMRGWVFRRRSRRSQAVSKRSMEGGEPMTNRTACGTERRPTTKLCDGAMVTP